MPAVANPITFGGSSRNYGYNPPSRIEFSDLPYLQRPGMTRGVPTYTVGGGSRQPIRPGVGLGTGQGTTIVSGYSPISYNPNTRNNSFDVADDEYGPISTEDMIKATATDQLLSGGVGALSARLLGQNLTGVDLGGGFLGQVPYLGRGLKELDYFLNPTYSNAIDASGFLRGTARYIKDFPGRVENAIGPNSIFGGGGTGPRYAGGSIGGSPISITNTLSSIGSGISSLVSKLPASVVQNLPGNTAMTYSPLGGGMPISPNILNKTKAAAASNAASNNPGFLGSVGNFFNQSRSFIPGVSGTGASATGFGGGGVPGKGITSIGNVLGTVGGILSLADFVKDPSLASGLGTLAGAGASGIGAFSGLAPAAPFLALGALAAGLLGIGNKKPSNKTGYASVDFDNLQSQSYSIGDYKRKKMNKENVEFTKKLLDPIIPYIEEIEKKYGFDLKGDLQISYGGRDGLFYNIGDIDQEGLSRRDMFLNRVDYYDGRDQNVYKRRFNTDEAGLTKFYDSILKDLENIAKNKITNLRQYRGIQRQIPQGVFSYGLPGGGMIPGNVTVPPKTKGGPQGVFTYGYNT